MLTDETKRKILQKILESESFKSSKKYREFLTYLVEASIKDEEPKEITIAIQFFGKSNDFNPSEDSSVRVYASNLRKKLDHYYANEGKNDKYRIRIPKGHYKIEFQPNEGKIKKRLKFGNKKLIYALTAVFIILIAITVYNFIKVHRLKEAYSAIIYNPIWENITESTNPKMIVLGNDLFYLEIQDGEETIVRKHYINTVEEFEEYKNAHPEKEIIGITPYPFFPKIDISTVPILIKLLNAKYKLSLKASYELKTKDLLENDIIFLGSFRSLHFLRYLLRDSLIEYSENPDDMYVKFNEPDTSFIFRQTGEPGEKHIDYCLFRKLPGPNKNTIYMFVSFFEAGISAATQYTFDEENIEKINELMEKRYGEMPEYFEILFKSNAYSRTPLNSEIIYFRKLEPKELNIW